jgi:hypothetical protein
MTELVKETIVACVGAAFTGVPAILLFWWTWRRDQERLTVQKLIDEWPTLDGRGVIVKDDSGIPRLGILVRNHSLFPVHMSAAGFSIDGEVLQLQSLNLPLRIRKNPDPSSNRPNVPDDSDPAEIRAGESLQLKVKALNPSDSDLLRASISRACGKHEVSAEELVLSRRVVALVALETGKRFSSLPVGKRLWRQIFEPLAGIWRRKSSQPGRLAAKV